MTTGKRVRVIISPDGVARGIHGPVVDSLSRKLGQPSIHRATYVEPTPELSTHARRWLQLQGHDLSRLSDKWWADMLTATSTLVLGPFDTQEQALAAETQWLENEKIPLQRRPETIPGASITPESSSDG